jgi:hypothetical protein
MRSVLWPMGLVVLTSCIEERLPVAVPVSFEGATVNEIPVPGGAVVLETAVLDVADLRFESGPDVAWAARLLPVAYAHPGHDPAGDLRVELLGEWSLDLLGTPTELGVAEGFEGDLATARFDAIHLALTGTFTSENGDSLPVELDLAIDRTISGIELAPVVLDAEAPPETLVWTVDLQTALSFTPFADTDGDGRITTADEDVETTTVFGVTSIDSWAIQARP